MAYEVLKAIFCFRAFFWAAKVAHQDYTATIGKNLLNGGYCGTHTRIVSNGLGLLVKRHVKVNTNQCFWPAKLWLENLLMRKMF